MTILQDECKPTQPTSSDAVVELLKLAIERAGEQYCELAGDNEPGRFHAMAADEILTTLSDAGLAVLPLEATFRMREAGSHCIYLEGKTSRERAVNAWRLMADAFHPSQLETKRD